MFAKDPKYPWEESKKSPLFGFPNHPSLIEIKPESFMSKKLGSVFLSSGLLKEGLRDSKSRLKIFEYFHISCWGLGNSVSESCSNAELRALPIETVSGKTSLIWLEKGLNENLLGIFSKILIWIYPICIGIIGFTQGI